jgi:hypothetical protein
VPQWKPNRRDRTNSEKGRYRLSLFGSRFDQKSINNTIDNSFKNQPRKSMDNDAKRMLKTSQNLCNNSLKFNAETASKKGRKIIKQHTYLEVVKP